MDLHPNLVVFNHMAKSGDKFSGRQAEKGGKVLVEEIEEKYELNLPPVSDFVVDFITTGSWLQGFCEL